MDITPRNDLVLVREIEQQEQLDSGLFIPKGAQTESVRTGTVISVGPGKALEDGTLLEIEDLSEGDEVIWSQHVGVRCELNREEYFLLRQNDVLAKLS